MLVLSTLALEYAAAEVLREERVSYVGGTGDVSVVCPAATQDFEFFGIAGLNVGGACFVLQGGETRVALEVIDDLGDHVGAFYRFRDASDVTIIQAPFCGATSTPVPPGSATLYVLVDEANAVFDCPLGGPSATGGAGVIGDVFARWT